MLNPSQLGLRYETLSEQEYNKKWEALQDLFLNYLHQRDEMQNELDKILSDAEELNSYLFALDLARQFSSGFDESILPTDASSQFWDGNNASSLGVSKDIKWSLNKGPGQKEHLIVDAWLKEMPEGHPWHQLQQESGSAARYEMAWMEPDFIAFLRKDLSLDRSEQGEEIMDSLTLIWAKFSSERETFAEESILPLLGKSRWILGYARDGMSVPTGIDEWRKVARKYMGIEIKAIPVIPDYPEGFWQELKGDLGKSKRLPILFEATSAKGDETGRDAIHVDLASLEHERMHPLLLAVLLKQDLQQLASGARTILPEWMQLEMRDGVYRLSLTSGTGDRIASLYQQFLSQTVLATSA